MYNSLLFSYTWSTTDLFIYQSVKLRQFSHTPWKPWFHKIEFVLLLQPRTQSFSSSLPRGHKHSFVHLPLHTQTYCTSIANFRHCVNLQQSCTYSYFHILSRVPTLIQTATQVCTINYKTCLRYWCEEIM